MIQELNIIKRDGKTVKFDKNKIENAILKSMKYGSGVYIPEIAKDIALDIESIYMKRTNTPTVYQVEEIVYTKLIDYKQNLTAKAYEG